MAERTRMALQAQKLFHGPPRRRRRGGLSGQAYFQDALQLLRLTVKATGQGADALARWEDEAQRREGSGAEEIEPSLLAEATGDAPPGAEATPVRAGEGDSGRPDADDAGEGAQRRRRGGRRRRRRGRGGGGSAQATPPAAPAAP
jgi:hypothetical protein